MTRAGIVLRPTSHTRPWGTKRRPEPKQGETWSSPAKSSSPSHQHSRSLQGLTTQKLYKSLGLEASSGQLEGGMQGDPAPASCSAGPVTSRCPGSKYGGSLFIYFTHYSHSLRVNSVCLLGHERIYTFISSYKIRRNDNFLSCWGRDTHFSSSPHPTQPARWSSL